MTEHAHAGMWPWFSFTTKMPHEKGVGTCSICGMPMIRGRSAAKVEEQREFLRGYVEDLRTEIQAAEERIGELERAERAPERPLGAPEEMPVEERPIEKPAEEGPVEEGAESAVEEEEVPPY